MSLGASVSQPLAGQRRHQNTQNWAWEAEKDSSAYHPLPGVISLGLHPSKTRAIIRREDGTSSRNDCDLQELPVLGYLAGATYERYKPIVAVVEHLGALRVAEPVIAVRQPGGDARTDRRAAIDSV
jgi:hypothetical protein